MIYCVSDIHGELDKFERMLERINFCDADRLYIIGDVIDRGAMGVELLQKIMSAANMTMLLGNHEQMCLSTLSPHNEFGARELWRQNGGMPTYRKLLYRLTPGERHRILRFLSGLPEPSGPHRKRAEIPPGPRLSRHGPQHPHLGPGGSELWTPRAGHHLHCGPHPHRLFNRQAGHRLRYLARQWNH